ncbi:MAG: hypothetical protein S4CHLAM2_02580 [Chlamydiales bacterium]|nr:hypothetical protein [Chlamydiales bacterium]
MSTIAPSYSPVTINPCTATKKCVHGVLLCALAVIAALGVVALALPHALSLSAQQGVILLTSASGIALLETIYLIWSRPRTSASPDLNRETLIQPTVSRTCFASRFVNGPYAPNPLWSTFENIELMPLGGFRHYPPLPEQMPLLFAPSPVTRLQGTVDIRWLGHASWLIRTSTTTILTDPNWSDFIPMGGSIPLYYRSLPPGLPFDDVPCVSHVCLSHTHRDHFDPPTLERFRDRDHPQVFCPERASTLLPGFTNVTECSWWDEHVLSEQVTLTFLPSTHASQTSALDCNRYLWGSYLLTIKTGWNSTFKIYYMGDSAWNLNPSVKGFDPRFWKDNVEKFHDIWTTKGPFDVVICGIDPMDGQEDEHANLHQLTDLFNRMKPPPGTIIPMHAGTWPFNRWGRDLLAPMRHFVGAIEPYPALRDALKPLRVGEQISLA